MLLSAPEHPSSPCLLRRGMPTIFLRPGKFQPALLGNFQPAETGEYSTGIDIRPQTVLDWIAGAPRCGPAGQRVRLIHARGFLKHLKASFPETEVPPPGILAPVM